MKKVITSLQHPEVKHWTKLRKESDYRKENQRVLIEGKKLIAEFPLKIFKIIKISSVVCQVESEETWEVTEEIMKKISGVQSPEGLMAEVAIPSPASLNQLTPILALDRISDPGNMGTLLRTALAFGWKGVFILNNSCDPYNDKTVRAAKGAQFKLPLQFGSESDLKKLVEANKLQAYVADLEGMAPEKISKTTPRVLILGNEAEGPSKGLLNFCKKISLPMQGEMESLNVSIAGGILMYLLRQEHERA